MRLSRETLHGIYAGLPLPWTESGDLDTPVFVDAIGRLLEYRPMGVYNGGSTGEFFAQSWDLYCRATDALLGTCSDAAVYTQVGIGATCTREAIRRGRYAIDRGVSGLQVVFPYWQPLSDDEAVRFYAELHAALDGFPLIHYDVDRSKRRLTQDLLTRICDVAPGLIGVKYTGGNFRTLRTLISLFPEIRFFVGGTDWYATLHRDIGIGGAYDPLVYMNPPLILRMNRLCCEGRYEQAMEIQYKLQRFHELREACGLVGFSDAALDRAIGLSTDFLRGYTLVVQSPYEPVPPDRFRVFQERLRQDLPELFVFE